MILGSLVANDDGGTSLNLDVNQISREGDVNEATMDILAPHQILEKMTKNLKQDLARKTRAQLTAEPITGKEVDVNYGLHKGLATMQCECNSDKHLAFKQATVYVMASNLISHSYKAEVTYQCEDCGETATASGSFKRTGLKQLFRNH